MKINDKLYGSEDIESRVICDLINSKSIQRLKDISQLGIPDEYSNVRGFSRYEHSIGVMLLLRKLNASLEEQVAGLLHDVSHTPFSHVIDWVIGDPSKEDYQDKTFKEFLKNSEIPKILKKHNFDLERVSNHEKFRLLEREPPSLCADRIDYTLRQIKEKKLISKVIGDLDVKNSQIVFRNKEVAESFGKEYASLQREHWAGDEMRSRYYILSEILKKAFKDNLINSDFFKGTEKPILEILANSKDKFISYNMGLLKNGFCILEDPNGIELKTKFRYIDPEVIENGSYISLSGLSKEYSSLIESEKENSKLIKKIRIIPN